MHMKGCLRLNRLIHRRRHRQQLLLVHTAPDQLQRHRRSREQLGIVELVRVLVEVVHRRVRRILGIAGFDVRDG